MNIYLAGPVDYHKAEQSWKEEIVKLSENNGFLFYNPDTYKFNDLDEEKAGYIYDVNMFALERSDVILARWMKGQVSVGTPIELYHANYIQTPIILITDMHESVYLTYLLSVDRNLYANSINTAYGMLLNMKTRKDLELAKMKESHD